VVVLEDSDSLMNTAMVARNVDAAIRRFLDFASGGRG
jgi:hypothetical protein